MQARDTVLIAVLVIAGALYWARTKHPPTQSLVILTREPRGIGPSPSIVRYLTESRGFVVRHALDKPSIVFLHNLSDYDILYGERVPRGSAVYTLPGINALASKASLAVTLRKAGMGHVVPETHVGEEMARTSPGMWIWKTDMQRQIGVAITRDDDRPPPGGGYVVRQRLLQNPLLVNGRKINLRVYVLLWLEGNELSCAPYSDGFLYYTPEAYVPGSVDVDRNVTTGYIDREVYRANPLTLGDLRAHMGDEKYAVLWGGILRLLSHVRECYEPVFLSERLERLAGIPHFNVMGCDIGPCDDLSVLLMEFNKTPDLGAKDERDRRLKESMVRWAFGGGGA